MRAFPDTDPTRLLNGLNAAGHLERTVVMPLGDPQVGAPGYFGSVAVDSLGALAPGYCVGLRGSSALTTTALTVNVIRAVPFVHNHGFRLTEVGIGVSAGAANAKIRLGIYGCRDDRAGDWTPLRKVYGSAELSGAAAGSVVESGLTKDLEYGRVYWAAYLCGTLAPTVYTIPVAGCDHLMGGGVGNPPSLSTFLQVNYTYAALPDIFPSGSVANNVAAPAIFLAFTRPSAATITRRIPCRAITRAGAVLQRAYLLKGSDVTRTPSGYPHAVVRAKLRNATGATTVGEYDSRNVGLSAGVPLLLTGGADLGQRLSAGDVLEAEVTQVGYPRVSLADATLEWDLAYSGA